MPVLLLLEIFFAISLLIVGPVVAFKTASCSGVIVGFLIGPAWLGYLLRRISFLWSCSCVLVAVFAMHLWIWRVWSWGGRQYLPDPDDIQYFGMQVDILAGTFCSQIGVALIVGAMFRALLLWQSRVPAGFCRECRYDLRGSPSGKCPECGFQNTGDAPMEPVRPE
ncbi:MAG: hypothetical protein SF069_04760 [Phycisphaerae bacterium]|nr:hypothetical protein [Phycisphaerae bacterium]